MAAVPFESAQPPYGGATSPLVVVSPHFVVPYPTELVASKKVMTFREGEFTVTDVKGVVLFRVRDKSSLGLCGKRVLLDAMGCPILTLREEAWSARSRWRAYRGEGKSDVLFSIRRSSAIQGDTKLNVYMSSNVAEQTPDFYIKGNFSENKGVVYLENTSITIAQMHRNHTIESILEDKDKYGVSVSPYVDHAFIVALLLVFHEIIQELLRLP